MSSSTTEADRATARSPPPPLRPEYAHPAGVEALDPYHEERDAGADDADYEEHARDDAGDELPALGGDHLLRGHDDLPVFLLEPQPAFALRSRPATLRCRAAGALQVYFKCNGARTPDASQFEFVDPQSGVRIVEAECNVTRDHLEEYFGDDPFSCECFAWSGRGNIRSRPAVVRLACE